MKKKDNSDVVWHPIARLEIKGFGIMDNVSQNRICSWLREQASELALSRGKITDGVYRAKLFLEERKAMK
jgi:hypothetical protein